MSSGDFIYLQTLQHTGTWFVIYFVCDHPEVGGFVMESNLFDGLKGKLDKVHNESGRSEQVPEQVATGKKTLLFGHIVCHSQESPPYLCPRQQSVVLAASGPIVVPLRDPLLAMITHEKRIDDFENFRLHHKITCWRLYFEFLMSVEKYKDVVYLPIDVLDTREERLKHLKQVQAAYGLESEEIAQKWADKWAVYNSYVPQNHPNKVAYANRDLPALEKTISHSLKALRDSEDILRPIMKRWYKDLLWWS